jgi:glycosyltransferase involved in cell wall biosynthesis
MKVSVVIPLYNKEAYITRTIDSVLSQTYTNFELLIVDDGSSDNSINIARSYKDIRIRIIKQENRGVSNARNNGIINSQSEWVAFLDADDEYEPSFLENVVNFIQKYDRFALVFVGTNYYLGSKNNNVIRTDLKSGVYDYFQLFTNQKSPNNSSTTVVKRDAFLCVGGFPEGITQFEDWITWFKLACVGNFGYIETPLGIYNLVVNSVSNSNRNLEELYLDAIQLPKTTLLFINQYNISLFKKKNALKCISEFSLSLSMLFANKGKKGLAIKMLYYYNFKFLIKDWNKAMYLIIHLIIPQVVKLSYWKLKKRHQKINNILNFN